MLIIRDEMGFFSIFSLGFHSSVAKHRLFLKDQPYGVVNVGVR